MFLRFLSKCFWMDLALFTKKYRTSGIDGARSSFLRKRRNLMPANNSTCSTVKPSLNVTTTKRAPYSLHQPANLLLENLRLHLDPTQGPAHVLERCEDILLPRPYKRPSKMGQHQPSTMKCLASERKLRSSKRRSTRSRKGTQTTARPLLANTRLSGETCVKNFADTCYTASGSRAEPELHPTKRIITAK